MSPSAKSKQSSASYTDIHIRQFPQSFFRYDRVLEHWQRHGNPQCIRSPNKDYSKPTVGMVVYKEDLAHSMREVTVVNIANTDSRSLVSGKVSDRIWY